MSGTEISSGSRIAWLGRRRFRPNVKESIRRAVSWAIATRFSLAGGNVNIPFINLFGVLEGWTLFTAGGQGVPDGGTTVMLLGAPSVRSVWRDDS